MSGLKKANETHVEGQYRAERKRAREIWSMLPDTQICRAAIKAAFRTYARALPPKPSHMPHQWKPEHHTCDPKCDYFMHEDTYICRRSGGWHYCTVSTCDQQIPTDEVQYCPISGSAYPLDFVYTSFSKESRTVDDDTRGTDHPPAAETVKPQKKKRRVTSEIKESGDDEYKTPAMIALAVEQPKPKIAARSDSSRLTDKHLANSSGRSCRFIHVIERIFEHTTTEASDRSLVCNNALRIWMLLAHSQVFLSESYGYNEDIHILVILEHLKNGYSPLGIPMIPRMQWVRAHMPCVRNLGHLNVRVPSFTKAKKLFDRVCIDLIKHPVDLAQQLRMPWRAH